MTDATHVHRPAIVIFGAAVQPGGRPSRTLRRRVAAAAVFARQLGGHPLLVPTGGIGKNGPAEAEVMARQLTSLGVAAADIVREPTGTDTLSSVRAVLRLIGPWPGRVYAATSTYHQPRCVLLLRLAGFDAHAALPPPGPAARAARLRWYWRLREVAALPWDVALLLGLRLLRRL